ncbi:molybdate ABC transporter substrate-binding protein [Tissierellaceae bacterium HCP3S3_D8]
MKLKKAFSLFLVLVLTMSLVVGCGNEKKEVENDSQTTGQETEDENVELLVSAAASLTDVLNELGEIYMGENQHVNLDFTYGSSGALQVQIEEGAPVDVFLSAAQKQMDALQEGGHIVEDTRKTLLINKVVLVTPENSELGIESFEDLAKDDVKKIAIGDPSNVPVGQYSEEVFTNLNIIDDINPKAVYATDVRTVLTWVESGEVDCGIVYATDAYTTDKVKIIAEAPEGSHKEVSYPVAAIKDSKTLEASQAFIDFLSTEQSKEIFKKYGFDLK